MKIQLSTTDDIPAIFSFYEMATEFQKTKFHKHWLPFDRELVKKEIEDCRQWKILEEHEIACIFAIAYEDPFIWKEENSDPAVYIHRIVTHNKFRGKGYVKQIIEWAKQHAAAKQKRFLRMDTWGDNETLINYYIACGFKFLGVRIPDSTDQLPKHYSAINLAFFEIDLQD